MKETRQNRERRKLAYLRTFCGDRQTPHIDGEIVLADLKKFCGMVKRAGIIVSPKSGMTDPYATCYQAGLRDAYLHITGLIGIDINDLFKEGTHDESETSDPSAAER